MTVADALACGAPDASALLAHLLEKDRAWLIAHARESLTVGTVRKYDELCARRQTGEPFAYLLESAGFYGREFVVNPSVLIPRPETEHLIEEAIAFLRPHASEGKSVSALDVGVGSGAIACTLAAEVPSACIVGTDISAAALDVARMNAARIGVADRCRFSLGDLLEPLPSGSRFRVIVANLPYVPSGDIACAPDPVSFEPRLALDGGADGLALYRRFVPQVGAFMAPGSLLLLEAAPPIIAGLESLLRASFPRAEVSIGFDYGGRQRFVRVLAE